MEDEIKEHLTNSRKIQNTHIATKHINCDEHSFDFVTASEDDSDIPNDETLQVLTQIEIKIVLNRHILTGSNLIAVQLLLRPISTAQVKNTRGTNQCASKHESHAFGK